MLTDTLNLVKKLKKDIRNIKAFLKIIGKEYSLCITDDGYSEYDIPDKQLETDIKGVLLDSTQELLKQKEQKLEDLLNS